MQAPGVVFASDNDIAPVSGAVQCRIHVRGRVRLRCFFGLFQGLGVATPPEFHLLDHTWRSLRWNSVEAHIDVVEGEVTFDVDCHTLQGFPTQEHRQVEFAVETRCSLSR
jgi:hypothetical protein